MNILFTICGRAGSKGLKSKNLLGFCGIPLPYYSLGMIQEFRKTLQEYHQCDIVLSTDSKELMNLIKIADSSVFCLDRSEELSGDFVRKIDVIRDAAHRASAHFKKKYDMVIDLDITSPLRRLQDLVALYEKRAVSDADVIYTVVPARRSPWFNMVMKHENGFYSTVIQSTFATRQETPEVFEMNASIYGYSANFIDSDEPLFRKSDIVIMKDTGVLDIDGPEDYELMQIIGQYLFNNNLDFRDTYHYAKAVSERTQSAK